MTQELYRIDGILWDNSISPKPFCPVHKMEMDAWTFDDEIPATYDHVKCAECTEAYPIPRDFDDEQIYVRRKIKSRALKDIRVLNIDDEAVPIAEFKASSKKNKKFFVTGVLTESKVGQRLIIYAGERGKNRKTQIFVEPEIKRIAFDQRDLHPTDVFTEIQATFADGSSTSMKRKKIKD